MALAFAIGAYADHQTVYHFYKPLYGAAYYSEYTPTDRLDEDIRLMKQAGLTVVRVGESTWSLFEPHDGSLSLPGWTAFSTNSMPQASRLS